MQNKVNQHPFTENVIIQNWFEVSNQNSGYCSGSNKSLDKLIFASRQNVIRKRKNAIAEMIFTPLFPLYRSINFLNLLRSGTKLELSTLFFSYRLIFFKGPTSSISSKKCQKSSILFRYRVSHGKPEKVILLW